MVIEVASHAFEFGEARDNMYFKLDFERLSKTSGALLVQKGVPVDEVS